MQQQDDRLFAPRRARPDEAPAVADLWLRSRWASVPSNPPPTHDDDDVRAHFSTVVFPSTDVWVVDLHDSLVALMVLDDRWLEHLHVHPDHTGRGIGSRLLTLAQQVRPAGLDLWTFQSNAGARRFYERHGFEAVEMTDGDNEERSPDVRYRWGPKAAGITAT